MTVKDIVKAFKLEIPNTKILIKDENENDFHYNEIYVKWLEKKLADFLTQ
jgi:hypothetical protein